MRKTARARIALASFSLLMLPSSSQAQGGFMDWFRGEPKNYEDCVLQNMRGVTSDLAARGVMIACRNRDYPNKKHAPQREILDITTEMVRNLSLQYDWGSDLLYYKGFHEIARYVVTKIIISSTDGQISREIECEANELKARLPGTVKCPSFFADMKKEKITSRVVRVYGYRE